MEPTAEIEVKPPPLWSWLIALSDPVPKLDNAIVPNRQRKSGLEQSGRGARAREDKSTRLGNASVPETAVESKCGEWLVEPIVTSAAPDRKDHFTQAMAIRRASQY